MSNDLTEFLLARIAEDEAVAHVEATLRSDDPYWTSGETSEWERRQTPARVLAECDAKRRIVEEWQSRNITGGWFALACLALPYAGHPDYRPEWRP